MLSSNATLTLVQLPFPTPSDICVLGHQPFLARVHLLIRLYALHPLAFEH